MGNRPILSNNHRELADLMMTSGREVEESITRLAQMARAVGITLCWPRKDPQSM